MPALAALTLCPPLQRPRPRTSGRHGVHRSAEHQLCARATAAQLAHHRSQIPIVGATAHKPIAQLKDRRARTANAVCESLPSALIDPAIVHSMAPVAPTTNPERSSRRRSGTVWTDSRLLRSISLRPSQTLPIGTSSYTASSANSAAQCSGIERVNCVRPETNEVLLRHPTLLCRSAHDGPMMSGRAMPVRHLFWRGDGGGGRLAFGWSLAGRSLRFR